MNIYGSLMDIYDKKTKTFLTKKTKTFLTKKTKTFMTKKTKTFISKKHHPILLSTIQKQAQLEYRTALAIL